MKNGDGDTALHIAASRGSCPMMGIILFKVKGEEFFHKVINAGDSTGRKPLDRLITSMIQNFKNRNKLKKVEAMKISDHDSQRADKIEFFVQHGGDCGTIVDAVRYAEISVKQKNLILEAIENGNELRKSSWHEVLIIMLSPRWCNLTGVPVDLLVLIAQFIH